VTRSELDDERSFLLDSLEDLERERAAGDLSEADYVTLRDRYTRRAADVLRALDDDDGTGLERTEGRHSGAEPESRPELTPPVVTSRPRPRSRPRRRERRRRRTLFVMGLLVLLAAVAVTVVVTQSGTRLPGETETGSVSLSRAAQLRRTLAQAETLEAQGNAPGAVRLYNQVLAQDPAQPDALAQLGWLEFQAGAASRDTTVLSKAQQLEQEAQRAEPSAYSPHLYLGSMLLAEGDDTGAVGQYRQFLADDPPQVEVRAAQQFITEAFSKAGQPVPAMPGTTPTTVTPTTVTPTTVTPTVGTPPSG
jgi:tetratricopeptide (TPR) repeat protein